MILTFIQILNHIEYENIEITPDNLRPKTIFKNEIDKQFPLVIKIRIIYL